MLKKLSYIGFICLLATLSAYSQALNTTAYELEAYKQAKKYYQQADYRTCQDILAPLLASSSLTSITPYAFFYYALAAYRCSMPEVAEMTFTKLVQFYPTWHQVNEVLYWLAQLRFEQQDYITAFFYLAKIKDASLDTAISQMKNYFLERTENIDLLDTLLRHYPHDLALAKAWLTRQQQLPFMKQDTERMHIIAQRFSLAYQLYDRLEKLTSVKKDTYHVAVFFPFFIDEVNYEEKSSNQFVLDLYKGIQAAIEKLHQEGIHIVLHAYDTKKSATVTAHLLEQKELKTMDLLLGPLYANTMPLVADFARKHEINLFNPLSVNSQAVGNNPFVYLLKPSLETQAKQAAYFTQQQADLLRACIGVVYGTSAEDLLKANIYKSYIEQATGKEIEVMLELDTQASQQFLNMFRNTNDKEQVDQPEKFVLDSLTHIYIASQDELLIANVLSAVQIRKLNPYILADEICLKKASITLDQLQQLQISFMAPDYIDYNQESLHSFRCDFYNQFGTYPNYYAEIGYDMMLFLGSMLFQYGIYFQKHWETNTYKGQVFSGFSYGKHHDNQHIPIIQFQKSAFMLCNP